MSSHRRNVVDKKSKKNKTKKYINKRRGNKTRNIRKKVKIYKININYNLILFYIVMTKSIKNKYRKKTNKKRNKYLGGGDLKYDAVSIMRGKSQLTLVEGVTPQDKCAKYDKEDGRWGYHQVLMLVQNI